MFLAGIRKGQPPLACLLPRLLCPHSELDLECGQLGFMGSTSAMALWALRSGMALQRAWLSYGASLTLCLHGFYQSLL